MFRRRFIRIVALVFVFALVFTISFARGGAEKKKAPKEAPPVETKKDMKGTVRWYKGPFGPNEVELQNNIAVEFNKEYPNIEVTFEMFDWHAQEAQITAGLAGGAYDMIYIPEGMYPKFCYQGGPLEDLAPYVEDTTWQEERNNVLYWEDATSPDGFLGGVPNVWIPESHFVANLDLLEEAGIPDDWYTSMDKVRDAAIKMTKGDVYGIAWRTSGMADVSHHDWYGYVLRSGVNFLNEDFTACGLNKPELVETFQWLVDLQNKYKVTPRFGEYNWQGLRALFQAGRIAILHDEPLIVGGLKANPPDFKYDFFPIPGNVKDVLLTFRGFYVIPKTSKNKEAAWEMIKFWVRPEHEVNYLNNTDGLYPALKDLKGKTMFPGGTYGDEILRKGMDLAKYGEGPLFHPQMLEFMNLVHPLTDAMLQGKISPEELIEQACEQINAKLKK
ncbi:MAG: sugar ABC transporter substrate-binding protein [Spirochaetota bacterium]|nr:MAG: sugar ABC transporter substrate-binding protein [Spirochaetota bacterium]